MNETSGYMVAFVNWINSKWANFDEWLNNLGGESGGILDKRQDRQ